ncbi:MAG: LysR family transcriptional regulator, partial [Chitinophagaceae bacterium]
TELPDLKTELVEPEDIDFEDMLLNYHMDLALRRDSAKNPALQSECLYNEPFALIVPENHSLTTANYAGLEKLTAEKFILSGLHHNTFYGASLKQIFSSHNFAPQVTIESDYGATVLSLVAMGLGVTILPASYAFSAKAGVRFINLPYQTSLYANWRRDDNNPALRNLLQLVRKVAPKFNQYSL